MKKFLSLLLILALALSLCACGGAAEKSAAAPESAYGGYDVYATADEAEWAEEAEWDADYSANGLSASPTGGSDAPDEQPGKIIYSANVQVETTDFEGSLQKLDALIAQYGGWVESSSVNGSNYADRSRGNVSRRSASYVLRIPAEHFNEMMGTLSGLGNIPYTHVYTENVTAQYYDVQARLTALEAQEQRLLEMMEKAETVEDIIILEDRLTEVRYRIESLQSSLNNWDRQVSYSTVYLDVSEVQEYTPEPQVQPSFGQKLLAALKDGAKGLGSFFEELLLALAAALPAMLILAVIVLIPLLLLRRKIKNRRAQKAAPAPASPEQVPEEPTDEKKGDF